MDVFSTTSGAAQRSAVNIHTVAWNGCGRLAQNGFAKHVRFTER